MRETLGLALLSLLIAVGSLAAVGWAVLRAVLRGLFVGEILSLDGLLMIALGLLISSMFGFCALWLAHDAGLLERLRPRRASAKQPASAPEGSPAEQ